MRPCRANRIVVSSLLTLAMTSGASAGSLGTGSIAEDLGSTYRFLVTERSTQGGALYRPAAYRERDIVLPFSFEDSAEYWGMYVCAFPDTRCAVTDRYDPANYALEPEKGTAGVLQTERVNVHNGTNIYDAAVWQIAVVLGSVVNGFGNTVDADAYHLATRENSALTAADNGAARIGTAMGGKALTQGLLYRYNGHVVDAPLSAYAFRMAAPAWLADDPLGNSRYASLVTAVGLPRQNPDYRSGKIVWTDWKPVTGENAWAYLLGPLQAAYVHYVVGEKGKYIPFEEPAVRSALDMLPTFAAMQSPLGAIYYAPSGTLKNDGNETVDPHFVSVENNFSLLAGLSILRSTLQAELANDGRLSRVDRDRIRNAQGLIGAMIDGGEVAKGQATAGLLNFFRTAAWDGSGFVQGGFANDPARKKAWVPVLRPRAVDVNTWGVAALGADRVDDWFGFGAAFRVWSKVKSWGAYGVGPTLWGVGYSDQDGNGMNPDGTYRQGVLSSEWTAGAIVMVRNMIRHYGAISPSALHGADAANYRRHLRDDESAMLNGVQHLRFDQYQSTDFPGKPANYPALIPQPNQPYLYASSRYRVPFGWYANPIPSTVATAWVVLLADDFDPFGYGGIPN
jgi:hypothetical protein